MKLVQPVDLFRRLAKTGSVAQGRLLGLDVGRKYVGLAVSDIENKIASPHSVLVRKQSNIDFMAKDFQTLVSRYSLSGFIVGYPFGIQGQNSVEAIQVKLLIEKLKNTGLLDDMSYTYWNENYTSKCVEALLEPLNIHPVEVKTILDKFAAVGILQGYLDDMQRKLKSGEFLEE